MPILETALVIDQMVHGTIKIYLALKRRKLFPITGRLKSGRLVFPWGCPSPVETSPSSMSAGITCCRILRNQSAMRARYLVWNVDVSSLGEETVLDRRLSVRCQRLLLFSLAVEREPPKPTVSLGARRTVVIGLSNDRDRLIAVDDGVS